MSHELSGNARSNVILDVETCSEAILTNLPSGMDKVHAFHGQFVILSYP